MLDQQALGALDRADSSLLAYLDNTGEFLAAQLRPGNAGSNTATDHITVLNTALAQVPDAYRHGHPILVRADGAGCTKAFLGHIGSRDCKNNGVTPINEST